MTKLAQWERKNKEMRRIFRVLIHALRRAGLKDAIYKDEIICFDKPEIKIILINKDKADINPEIAIKFWR